MRPRMKDCLTPSQLLDLTVEPNWARSDPARHRCLAVDLTVEPLLNTEDTTRLSTWIAQQPIPIIGIDETLAEAAQTPPTTPHQSPPTLGGGSTMPSEDTANTRQPVGQTGANRRRLPALSEAMDLIVEKPAELQRVREQIKRFPIASAVLVQVLRASGKLGSVDALAMESLAYAVLQGGSEFAAWLPSQRTRNPRTGLRKNIVLVERRGDILHVVLDSPENRNALSMAMRDALTEVFQLAVQDSSIKHIDVSANGPCFSAGGDLTEFGTATDLAQAHRIRMTHMPARYLAACRDRCRFHVQGACIGAGIELPAFAARLIAKPDATFRLPEVGMGLIPGAGGCVSIPQRIGRQRTALFAILGEAITAEQALAWGLIDAIES